MPWGWLHFRLNEEKLISELINSPLVLTMDEITFDEEGNYKVLEK